MANRTVDDLKPNPRNPRTITDKKLGMLAKALAKFGDLSGVVLNRRTDRLVGGHQRTKVFAADTPVILDKTYPEPTKTGTVAEGHILWKGERHRYRVVDWDEKTEMAANLAANKGAGEFDFPAVAEFAAELQSFEFDLDLTMFDADERAKLTPPSEFLPSEEEPARLDENKKKACPSCGYEF